MGALVHPCISLQADTNGDGMIEYDEFLAYFHKHEPQLEVHGFVKGLAS